MGKKRICYVVHWSAGEGPESRIYPNLSENLVNFMSGLKRNNDLSSGPVVERIVLSDLTRDEKKKLEEIQNV